MFGKESHVDEVRHFIDVALGWGGMPESEVHHIQNYSVPEGHYTFTLRGVTPNRPLRRQARRPEPSRPVEVHYPSHTIQE